jgi:predicted nucleic acid-binding protein
VTAVYADASALFKLVWDEPESAALDSYLAGADILSSELVLAEVPRALRRVAGEHSIAPLDPLLERAHELLAEVAVHPLEPSLLEEAGAIDEPSLRTLDAVHVVTAIYLEPIEAFVTYDVRQAAVARLAGLRTVAPGF